MVKYADGVWHCIHPEFLRDQLARSRERLQVETLDVCLLHNPEYYLTDAHERSHGTLEKRRQEFDRRIRDAFVFLEAEVAAGRIARLRRLVQHLRAPRVRSRVHLAHPHARAGARGGRRRPPLPRAAAAR